MKRENHNLKNYQSFYTRTNNLITLDGVDCIDHMHLDTSDSVKKQISKETCIDIIFVFYKYNKIL